MAVTLYDFDGDNYIAVNRGVKECESDYLAKGFVVANGIQPIGTLL